MEFDELFDMTNIEQQIEKATELQGMISAINEKTQKINKTISDVQKKIDEIQALKGKYSDEFINRQTRLLQKKVDDATVGLQNWVDTQMAAAKAKMDEFLKKTADNLVNSLKSAQGL